jgi:hypothetical protein
MKAHLGTTCLGTLVLTGVLLVVSTWQITPQWLSIVLGTGVLLGGIAFVAVWEQRRENNRWQAAAEAAGLESGSSGLGGVYNGRSVQLTFSDMGGDEEVRTIEQVQMTLRQPIPDHYSFAVTARKSPTPRKNEHILGNDHSIYESNPPDFAAHVFDHAILRDMLQMNDSGRGYVRSIQLARSQLRFEPAMSLWPEDVEPALKALCELARRVEALGKSSA